MGPKRPDPPAHVHGGNTYKLYDNDGAVRCEYHSCPYNIYNAQIGDYPDEPDEPDESVGR
jgi:hypothetical protein